MKNLKLGILFGIVSFALMISVIVRLSDPDKTSFWINVGSTVFTSILSFYFLSPVQKYLEDTDLDDRELNNLLNRITSEFPKTAHEALKELKIKKWLYDGTLNNQNFYHANLRGENLDSALLWKTNFSYSNLEKADMKSSFLKDANLEGANLRGADLSYANLSNANLDGADLRGAILTAAILNGASLKHTLVSGADFKYSKLKGAYLRHTDLSGAYFILIEYDDMTIFPPNFKKTGMLEYIKERF